MPTLVCLLMADIGLRPSGQNQSLTVSTSKGALHGVGQLGPPLGSGGRRGVQIHWLRETFEFVLSAASKVKVGTGD